MQKKKICVVTLKSQFSSTISESDLGPRSQSKQLGHICAKFVLSLKHKFPLLCILNTVGEKKKKECLVSTKCCVDRNPLDGKQPV